jgi:alpha-L-rhamnosidase
LAPAAGSFSCSKELFNRTFALIDWAIRSNLASVPTDCPHREKLGWLEQTHLMGGSIQYNYRILTLYRKLVRDMMAAQLADGLVPDIAPEFVPFVGGFRDSPEWGSAAVILPWSLYEWYGDRETMAAAYPMMKRYVDYLATKAEGHILSHGLGDWYDLGPRFPGEAQLTPKALTATAIYYRDLDLLARMAALLGKADDAGSLAGRAGDVRKAFNAKFYDPAAKVYATGSQTAFAMPLHFGMVDERARPEVFRNLVRSIRQGGGALTAGDVGFDYLLKALEEGGASALIYEMNAREDVPGYGFQLAKGATALTESWAARREVSNNHMMLGHLMEWFYSGLAGIRQAEGSTGFATIEIKPHPVGDVTWVKARYHSIRGEIVSEWRIENSRFYADVTIPANAKALIKIPAASGSAVTEGGIPATRSAGVKFIGLEDGRAVFAVGSGTYRFAADLIR